MTKDTTRNAFKATLDAIMNIPIVKNIIDENNKLKRKNADLKKKNKALRSVIYTMPEFRNKCSCESSCDKPIVSIKKEKIDNDDDIEIIEPVEKENIVYVIKEEEKDDRYVRCDECSIDIDCHNNSIHVVYKGTPGCMEDDKTMCTMCFQEQQTVLIDAGYKCDDWSLEEDKWKYIM